MAASLSPSLLGLSQDLHREIFSGLIPDEVARVGLTGRGLGPSAFDDKVWAERLLIEYATPKTHGVAPQNKLLELDVLDSPEGPKELELLPLWRPGEPAGMCMIGKPCCSEGYSAASSSPASPPPPTSASVTASPMRPLAAFAFLRSATCMVPGCSKKLRRGTYCWPNGMRCGYACPRQLCDRLVCPDCACPCACHECGILNTTPEAIEKVEQKVIHQAVETAQRVYDETMLGAPTVEDGTPGEAQLEHRHCTDAEAQCKAAAVFQVELARGQATIQHELGAGVSFEACPTCHRTICSGCVDEDTFESCTHCGKTQCSTCFELHGPLRMCEGEDCEHAGEYACEECWYKMADGINYCDGCDKERCQRCWDKSGDGFWHCDSDCCEAKCGKCWEESGAIPPRWCDECYVASCSTCNETYGYSQDCDTCYRSVCGQCTGKVFMETCSECFTHKCLDCCKKDGQFMNICHECFEMKCDDCTEKAVDKDGVKQSAHDQYDMCFHCNQAVCNDCLARHKDKNKLRRSACSSCLLPICHNCLSGPERCKGKPPAFLRDAISKAARRRGDVAGTKGAMRGGRGGRILRVEIEPPGGPRHDPTGAKGRMRARLRAKADKAEAEKRAAEAKAEAEKAEARAARAEAEAETRKTVWGYASLVGVACGRNESAPSEGRRGGDDDDHGDGKGVRGAPRSPTSGGAGVTGAGGGVAATSGGGGECEDEDEGGLLSCDHCAQALTKEAGKQCSSCKSAVYCSADCQRAHWKAHKTDCKRITKERQQRKQKEQP